MTEQDIPAIVRTCVAEGLFLSEDEVTPDTALFEDLAAESIDLLDILFRLERALGIRLKGADISEHILGGMTPDDFVGSDGRLTEQGQAQLHKAMPQLDVSTLGEGVDIMTLLGRFTVQNLTDLVTERVATIHS